MIAIMKNFASGALNIQSGRALTKEDRNKVLIHEELVKREQLDGWL